MATSSPFDLPGEDDADDPAHSFAAAKKTAKEARNKSLRGGGRGDGRGKGRGRGHGHGPGGSHGDGHVQTGRRCYKGYVDNVDTISLYKGYSGSFDGPEGENGSMVIDRHGGYGGSYGAYYVGQRGDFSNDDVTYNTERQPKWEKLEKVALSGNYISSCIS